jgi:hypothetical protein
MQVAAAVGADAPWLSALRRYLAIIVGGNLLWEFAHMPLYAIWNEGTWAKILFAAVHCTGGDILIALAALTLALMLVGTPAWPCGHVAAVAAVTIVLGVAYTGFSEYLNIVIRAAWAYSGLMPVVRLGILEIGLSPLLQWFMVPGIAFAFVRLSPDHLHG